MQPIPLEIGTVDGLDEYSCHVWRYSPSLSRLLLKLMRGDAIEGDSLYLLFVPVEFFSGSMVWKGARFELGGEDQVVELLARIHGEQYAAQYAKKHPSAKRLYVFGDRARILCHEALVYTDMPSDF